MSRNEFERKMSICDHLNMLIGAFNTAREHCVTINGLLPENPDYLDPVIARIDQVLHTEPYNLMQRLQDIQQERQDLWDELQAQVDLEWLPGPDSEFPGGMDPFYAVAADLDAGRRDARDMVYADAAREVKISRNGNLIGTVTKIDGKVVEIPA